ncbi:MAG: tetratricopeptide repeat protein, partial [Bacteroidia bacterium]
MSSYKELSEKITAAENGKGELFDAYMSLWINTPNISKEEIEAFIARAEKINPNTIQTRAWSTMTQGMRYSLWPGTGNAFEKLTETIGLFQQSNDKPGEGIALAMLSLYYKNLGQLDKAQECVNKAILNLGEGGKYLYFLGVAYFQGGEINQILKDHDAALNFFNKGLSYFENDTGTFKGRLLSGIGNIYKDKNELEVAFDYFQRSLKHVEGKNHYMLETKNYSDMGNYYLRKGDYDKSLEYQLKSLKIRKELNQTSPLITNYIELAELYLKQNKLEEALKNALLAETLSKEHNVIVKKYQSDLIISTIYEAMGNSALALEYYKRYHSTKDQVIGQENARKIKQISMHHEMETMHKEKEIFKLRNVVLKEALDEIGASVRYAKRIQEAILPPIEFVQSKFKDAFVLYKPKDVVAGDFYWMEELNDIIFIAVADCTGHGVPGALVSVICSNSLNRVIYEHKLVDPGDILEKTAELVCKTFEKSAEEVKDGMDISLLAIEKKKGKL